MLENNVLINSEGKSLIVENLYTVEEYFTFKIKVKSGEFAGASNFCMSKDYVGSIIEILHDMHKDLKGHCEVKDYDSDAHIVIEMNKFGHMCISGQIGGSHEEHSMKFSYNTDQTVLVGLIRILKELL